MGLLLYRRPHPTELRSASLPEAGEGCFAPHNHPLNKKGDARLLPEERASLFLRLDLPERRLLQAGSKRRGSQCRAARLPDAAAACPSSGITSVLLRLGTSPTGMTLITFIAAVSTTDTDFIEAFDT
jgi:hypothetical protein